MLSLIFLLSISFFVSEASARNPKYEKMLKHIVRHQKEYVGMDAGAFYQKIQEDGFPTQNVTGWFTKLPCHILRGKMIEKDKC